MEENRVERSLQSLSVTGRGNTRFIQKNDNIWNNTELKRMDHTHTSWKRLKNMERNDRQSDK